MAAFAILLAGDDVGSFEGHHIYANDLALWMRVLEHRFGLEQTSIIPLFSDGGTIVTTEPIGSFEAAAASRDELARAFVRAATVVKADDPFFFIVSNHGTRSPQDSAILLARRTLLTPDELISYAQLLTSKKQMYIFGQCGAARFGSIARSGSGRAVLAGCREHQGTYIRKDDSQGRTFQWTEFLFNLAAALGGDSAGLPPCPTLRAAFEVAENQSSHRKLDEDGEWPVLFDPDNLTSELCLIA